MEEPGLGFERGSSVDCASQLWLTRTTEDYDDQWLSSRALGCRFDELEMEWKTGIEPIPSSWQNPFRTLRPSWI